MYTLDKIKKQIVKQINEALGQKVVQASDLVYPPSFTKATEGKPQPDFGNLSLPCFEAAKKLGQTPVRVAECLISDVRVEGVITGLKAAGPYVNFTLNKSYLTKDALKQIEKMKGEYGWNRVGKNKRVMVEYSNANTHKEYHIGHLRNICYGDAINRILTANSFKTIPVSYINDLGIHVAKTLWAYLEFYQGKELPEKKGYFLGQVYVRAMQEVEKDPTAKKMVIFIMKKIESRKGAEYKLWQKTRQWSIGQFNKIYRELGVKFDHVYYESEFTLKGMKKVEELYKKRFLIKSEGTIIADLNKYDLGVLMLLRSDGTALYPVADIPLAIEKFKKYKLDKSIYVVDVRQSLYFKQLFKVLNLLGYKKEMIHLGYEFVKLPSGMISSRMGNVITYEDLREQVLKKAKSETKKRHQDWREKKIEQVATIIANGALKFEMVKVGADQVITFDINRALQFEGFTAAYLQYTYARIDSILRKAGEQKLEIGNWKFDKLADSKEHELTMELAKYPEIVLKASDNYDPSEVAKYLFDLAKIFNDYYHRIPVLKAEKNVRKARLALITAINQVIANGLNLLGIEVLEEM